MSKVQKIERNIAVQFANANMKILTKCRFLGPLECNGGVRILYEISLIEGYIPGGPECGTGHNLGRRVNLNG